MKRGLILIATLLSLKGYSQLFTFTFNGTGACPTQGASLTTQPANATVSSVYRTGTLSCSSTNDCFNSIGWSIASSIDLTQYIEVTVTAATGYTVNVSGIGFTTQRSSTGPPNGRISHDGGTGTFTATSDFSVGTTLAAVNWAFSPFSGTTGGMVKFRIYGWAATSTSSGTMRIDDLYVNATVTSSTAGVTPFTYDTPNSLVGLGKTPTQKLDVVGNIRASGKLIIGDITDAKITALTDYSLAVNGEALFSKARVLLTTKWPDYVFDEKYALLPLPQLEKYITENKHLPGMLPASETEKAGIDMAGTQSALLQKIEELTLYVIDQDKKIEMLTDQNKLLKELKDKITALEKQTSQVSK